MCLTSHDTKKAGHGPYAQFSVVNHLLARVDKYQEFRHEDEKGPDHSQRYHDIP